LLYCFCDAFISEREKERLREKKREAKTQRYREIETERETNIDRHRGRENLVIPDQRG